MSAKIISLLDSLHNGEHIVTVQVNHSPLFGETWQPVCLEDQCGWVGGFVPRERAHDIAAEHRQKSLGTWEPVR